MGLNVSDDFLNEYVNKKKRKKDEEDGLVVSDAFRSSLDTYNYNDIAPVPESVIRKKEEILNLSKTKKEKAEEKTKWYKTGLFEDGWDFGDVTKTILGVNEDSASVKDLTWNSIKRGYYNSLYGEESYKAMNGQSNDREYYKKLLEGDDYQFTPGNTFAEGVSGAFELLGQMGRQFTNPEAAALALGAGGAAAIAGQVGPQVLAPEEIVTVPVAAAAGWASGVAGQTFKIEAGHSYNELLEAGISEKTAKAVALAVGTGNAALEALQVDELFDAYKVLNKSGASKSAVKKILKELADRGVDVLTETAQEVAQEGITITGTQAASKAETGEWAYSASEVGNRLWDTAKSSALSFGMMNVPATAKNITSIAVDQKKQNSLAQKQNTLSEDEQTIFNKVVEGKIAEQEKDGNKLTEKQKNTIKEQTLRDLEKGYISAEKIEEIFGGEKYDAFRTAKDEFFNSDDYKSYQKAVEAEEKAKEEFEPLVKMVTEKMTGEQIYRRDELKKILDESKVGELKAKVDASAKNVIGLRNQMRSEMIERVKDSRLAESYRELARKNQKFTVDVNQYKNEYARKTIQSILDSGLGDNSNQFRETVDWLAKISADKNVTFNLTDNAGIIKDGHFKKGYFVNGYVNDNGDIVLNKESPTALNTTVGHEITHVLKKTDPKGFQILQKAALEYAVTKEGKAKFDARMAEAREAYKDKKNTTAEEEVTADIIGEYLFTDYEFVHSLSVSNRNVFQKVYDEIKYLVKIATAGSKEARELEKVKKMFDKAWRETGKIKENSGENTNYSLEKENKGKYNKHSRYSETETLFLSWENSSAPVGEVKKFSRFGKTRYYEKTENGCVELSKQQFIERNKVYAENIDRRAEHRFGTVADYDETTQRGSSGDYISNRDTSGDASVFGQTIREKLQDVSRGSESSTLRDSIGNTDINQSEYTEEASAEEQDASFITFSNDYAYFRNRMKEGDVGEEADDAPVKYSLAKDTDGKQLTKEQQEFFKDSKVVDENGNLKVMYHGTPNGNFTVFKDGTYFTDSKEYADKYQNPGASSISTGKVASNPKTFAVYLDIKKPFDLNDAEARNIYINEYIKGGNAMGINPYLSDAEYAKIQTIDWTEGEDLRDFLEENGYDYDGLVLDEGATGGYGDEVSSRGTSYVVFSPEQVKDVDNKQPTKNPDYRYSMTKADTAKMDADYLDAVNRGDMETAQRMVNERAEALRADVFAKTDVPTYRVRRGATPKNTIKVYKVFTISDTGKPSALFVNSQEDIPVGVWLDAQDTFHFTDQKNGHLYVPSTKNPNTKGGVTGRQTKLSDISAEDIAELERRGYIKRNAKGELPKSITSLAYRPGWHAGDLPFFPQGGMQIDGSNYPNVHRYNQVVFECEMIADNDYTDYHVNDEGKIKLHDMQEMPQDGSYKFATNPMAQSTDIGAWYIGSSIKINRALTQEECDRILTENGRDVQEWQAFQDPDELALIRADARSKFTDKKAQAQAAKNAEYEYEHRYGSMDLTALGYDPMQTDGGKKLLDAVTYDDNGNVIPLSERFNPKKQDVRYSMTKEEKAKMDADYMDAVNSGNDEVIEHLVREYAKASMPESKLVDENGNLRKVYHGTNTGDFTVFNPDYIGMSSGDDGFFGMGFYFAYSKGEAAYYGARRIIPAYLDLRNPFNFDKELQTYNGKKALTGKAPDAVALMNFADKFPDIAMHITLGAVKNGESNVESISVFEFAKAYKDIIENKTFEYDELVNEYGEKETLVTADPQVHEYEYNGETHSYRDFGFQKRWYGTPNELDVAYEYLANSVYSYLDIPRRTNVILDNNREFTEELKNRGYDGTIQSELGDEAVVFDPSQIKSAELITKDDDGNVIPLSKRFDRSNDDIRYSMTKVNELENAYQYDLDNEDMLGAEMVVEEMANLAMPDSKIRGKDGRLIPVYHGTNADFWEFDTSADGGKNGTAEGFGIYLSDDTEVTEIYGDRQIKMFANITKPATSFNKTINKSTLIKLIKDTCMKQAQKMVDEEGYDSLQDALRDTWISNYVMTYDMSMEQAYREIATSFLQQNDNDKDLIHEVMFGMAIRSYDQAMDFYRNSLTPVTGIDGFITKWTNSSTGKTSNIYLAFDSSQLKSADAVTRDDHGNVIPLTERFDFDKKDIRYSMSKEGAEPDIYGNWHTYGRDFGVHDPLEEFAPVREDATADEMEAIAPAQKATVSNTESVAPEVAVSKAESVSNINEEDEHPIKPTKEKLNEKLGNRQTELENIKKHRAEVAKSYDEKITKAEEQLASKKNKDTKVANSIKMRIERLKRLKAEIDAKYAKRINDITKGIDKLTEDLEKDHTEKDRYAKAKARIERVLESDKAALTEEYANRKAELEAKTADKDAYISNMARELYDEIRSLRKGVRASANLGSLLDAGFDWGNLRSALSNVRYYPNRVVNQNSTEEAAVRQLINETYESDVDSINDLDVELAEKVHKLETEADTEKDGARRATQRRKKSDQYNTEIRNMLGDTSTWVDLPIGLLYKTKTLRRILRTVVRGADGKPDIAKADQIYEYIETAYDHNEALLKKESVKVKEVFQKLNLNKWEDTYAHMAGEFRHNPETTLTAEKVKEYYDKHKKHIDINKVNTAIKEARKTFDELLVRVNEVLREQGFKEIPYRQGYFPHFTNPKQTWWQKALNWKPVDNEIPTSIAGLTETFKPQRSWQKFDKQRKSDQTDYSLYQGLDTYIHGALDWIYHIEDLQKRRELENYLRYIHSEEGVKAEIQKIKDSNLDAETTQTRIDEILSVKNNPLGGLVRELMNRTNTLANKKAAADRAIEDDFNRKIYSTMTNLNNRINANMVVGSLSSALTNFIPMVQSWHQVSPVYTVRGLGDMIRSTVRDDGMIAKSDYLTNRLLDEEKLYQTGWDKVSDKAAWMMNAVDNITSQTVWRSKYLQNIHEGMSENAAIMDADQFAKNLMAGRSRGNAPTIFDAKNPLIKIATAFQLEVANQYGYMFEDVPQDSTSKARLIKGYATAFVGAYVYNALYSSLVGRDAAFDPIGIIEDLLKDLFDDDDDELEDVLMDFGKNVIEEVPFVGGLIGGGRIPMSSALPYSSDSTPFQSMLTDVTEGNWESFGKEFLKPLYYLVMPVGGGQIKKSVEGVGMFLGDHPVSGSYTDSGKLRFPVEPTFGNVAQAALFGQYASKNARDYFDNERSPLGEKQIQEYMDSDLPIADYWNYRDGLKGLTKLEEKMDYIDSLDLPVATKNLFVNNIADRKEDINMESYGKYGSLEEFDFAQKNPKKYKFITEELGVTYQKYSNCVKPVKDAYDWAFENPEKYEFVKGQGLSINDYASLDDDEKAAYNWAYKNQEAFTVSKAISNDFLTYYRYKSEIQDIKDNNDSSSGTKDKDLVIDYINGLDIDYGQKIIFFRSMYDSKADKATYNADILDYLNSRDDLTYEERVTILKKLGFTVSSDGTVTW